jgi:UDP-N-acetylglucosamine transferase subunit ALG13
MDEIAYRTDEETVMQIGCATYLPQHAEYFRFTTGDGMLERYRDARVVVAQGGYSTVEILRLGKPLLVVPRQARYREHMNDHQVEFVRAMERRGLMRAVYDVENLEEALLDLEPLRVSLDNSRKQMLIQALHETIRQFEAESRDGGEQ